MCPSNYPERRRSENSLIRNLILSQASIALRYCVFDEYVAAYCTGELTGLRFKAHGLTTQRKLHRLETPVNLTGSQGHRSRHTSSILFNSFAMIGEFDEVKRSAAHGFKAQRKPSRAQNVT